MGELMCESAAHDDDDALPSATTMRVLEKRDMIDQCLGRIAELLRKQKRIDANVLRAQYTRAFGDTLDFRELGFRKLGNLLDQGHEQHLWQVERVEARRDTAGRCIESGSLFLHALADDANTSLDVRKAHAASEVAILNYYYYCRPRWNHEAVRATISWKQALVRSHFLRGRVRVAKEGVNVTLSGNLVDAKAFIESLRAADSVWNHVDFKIERCSSEFAWRSLQVWIANEICGLGCDEEQQLQLDAVGPGKRLDPDTFHAAIETGPPAVLIDVRNCYETRIGTFDAPRDSRVETLYPWTRRFTDFGPWLDSHLDQLRGKDVIMFCTGGVRCERASALVKSRLNSDRVFQLDGGIVRYMERHTDPTTSLFKGKNYVFDRRANHLAHPTATPDIRGRCVVCARSWDGYRGKRRCSTCLTLVIVCDVCVDTGCDKRLDLRCELCEEPTSALNPPLPRHAPTPERCVVEPAPAKCPVWSSLPRSCDNILKP